MPNQHPQVNSRRIFIGNVSYDASPNEVVDALRDEGIEIDHFRIATFRETGSPRGFGFLSLAASEARSTDDVIDLINQQGIFVRGRRLRADTAHALPTRPEGAAPRDRVKDAAVWRDPPAKKKRKPGRGKRPSGRGHTNNEFQAGPHEFHRRGRGDDGTEW